MTADRLDPEAEARIREAKKRAFWSRVQIGRGSACWPWTGCVDWDGYGLVRWAKRNSRAHRVAWQLMCGQLPSGICVLHRCDNPRCCNPAHLFLGTNRDNIADKVAKGRSRGAPGDSNGSRLHPESLSRGDRHWTRLRPGALRGDLNGASKLTDAKVREIRDLVEANLPQRWIAEQYGISPALVYYIARRYRWQHVA